MKRVQLCLIISILLAVACQPAELPASVETPVPLQPARAPSLVPESSPATEPPAATQTTVQADYYVAPTGNDANAGTLAAPWQTVQKAADTLVAGETVSIRGGTYHERVMPANSGEPGREITYMAYPGEAVTIDGEGIDHNLIDGFREYEGEIYGDDYIEGDPLFVDATARDFHLQGGSPAVDAGVPSDILSTDFDDNVRPQDSPDIGAYEFASAIE